jgi:hypothetical protein
MNNAAFGETPAETAGEVACILLELTKRIMQNEDGCQSGTTYPIRDSNGNKIGHAVFE